MSTCLKIKLETIVLYFTNIRVLYMYTRIVLYVQKTEKSYNKINICSDIIFD